MQIRFLHRLLTIVFALTLAAFAQTPGEFTVISLPDTQNEADYYPQVLTAEMQWIAANAKQLNIQFVIGLGDIVNNGSSATQYQNADASYKVLDQAGIPYMAMLGNHDYANAVPRTRDVTVYNQYFGPSRYTGKSYYQGSFPEGSNENFYAVFNINGTQYMVLCLEFIPRDAVVQWASTVLSQNLDKKVILVTHAFLMPLGYRQGHCDGNSAASFGLDGDNDAPTLWDKLISKYPNIIMVLNGHDQGSARRADLGDNGNLVNQILSDYQDWPNGGNGYLRIYTFKPSLNQVAVQSYSPTLNLYLTDSTNQFSIPITKPATTATTGTISGLVRNGSCQGVAGVKITAGGKSTTTASDGSYQIAVVPSAQQTVVASGAGLASNTQTVRVDAGYTAQLHFFMVPQGAATGSVTINSPARSSTVTSPVSVNATATSSAGAITTMQVYVDNQLAYTGNGSTLNTSLSLTDWGHEITIQATDVNGNVFTSYANVVVNTTGSINQPVQVVPDFAVTAAPQNAAAAGGSQFQITITPVNGFQDPVTLSCAGLPAGMGCSFSASVVDPASGAATSTLTIASAPVNSSLPVQERKLLYGLALPFFATALAGFTVRKRRRWMIALLLLAMIVSCVGVVGCGGGAGSAGGSANSAATEASNQNTAASQQITLTASSGAIQHSTVLTIATQ